ncbi:hypothetical protein MK079_02205 [Candidatus Gracilibacteria bacterium]|nr:hypothetical protein [Candidatus Gracilibacteria bacterium]
MSQWNVTTVSGKYTTLRVGHGKEIFLGSNSTGYKVGNDNRIYTTGGSFASKDSVPVFMKQSGLIKGVVLLKKTGNNRSLFLFFITKYATIIHIYLSLLYVNSKTL